MRAPRCRSPRERGSLRAVVLANLLASLAALGCAGPRAFAPFPAATGVDASGGELAVEWIGDLAFVPVRIDGGPERRMLLDTGASAMLLDPRVADELGLQRLGLDRERGGFVLPGANASSTRVDEIVAIGELRCGPLTAHGFDGILLDTGPLRSVLGIEFDGVVPFTVFRDAVLVIDYPQRRVHVQPSEPEDANQAGSLPLQAGRLPHVAIAFGDQELSILLDSGSSEFLAVPAAASLPLAGEPVETGRQQTIGGALPVLEARLALAIDWTGHRLDRPVAALGREERGSCGTALLRHFRVEFDQPNGRVRFAGPAEVPCPPTRSPGFGVLRAPDHWQVAYVLDGTPAAAAGIAVGDRVLAVDGVPVAAISHPRWVEIVASRPTVSLRVANEAGERTIDCAIAVLVP